MNQGADGRSDSFVSMSESYGHTDKVAQLDKLLVCRSYRLRGSDGCHSIGLRSPLSARPVRGNKL